MPEFDNGVLGRSRSIVTWSFVADAGLDTGFGTDVNGDSLPFGAVFGGLAYEDLLRQAFDTWSAAADIAFIEVADPGGDMVSTATNIRIAAADLTGTTVGLAHTGAGDLVLDPAGNLTTDAFLSTATHEIGHNLGLGHTGNGNSYPADGNVMSANRGNPPVTELTQYDVAELRDAGYQPQDFAPDHYWLTADQADFSYIHGPAQLSVHGNALDNAIAASDDGAKLYGGFGDDTLTGGAGNDALYGDDTGSDAGVLQPGPEGQDEFINADTGSPFPFGPQLWMSSVPDAKYNALLRFDLSDFDPSSLGAPAGAGIAAVELQVYVYIPSSAPDLLVDRFDETWGEGSPTPALPLAYTNLGAMEVSTSGGWASFDITGTVLDWLSDPTANFGIQLRNLATDGVEVIHSSNAVGDNALYRPRLVFHFDTEIAGAGSDTLSGGAGDDFLDGGSGADLMTGGTGDDIYVMDDAGDVVDEGGASGIDTVRASISVDLGDAGHFKGDIEKVELAGDDDLNVVGNGLDNTIAGNAGANALHGGDGRDYVLGGAGNDAIDGGDRGDFLFGDDGDDAIDGSAGNDRIDGGAGNDRLDGGADHDTIAGGAGDDAIYGGTRGDALFGNRGDDWIAPGSGADQVDGGLGVDRVWYGDSAGGVDVDLEIGTGSRHDAAGDTYAGIENVTGSAFADTITGNALGNAIAAGAGDDTVLGLGGRDVIEGGTGRDRLHGNDTLAGGEDNDRLYGGTGADRLDGGTGNDQLTGNSGADLFVFTTEGTTGFGGDIVYDFEDGIDLLDMRGVHSTVDEAHAPVTFDDLAVNAWTHGVKIVFEADQVIYLDDAATGIHVADIDAGDFLFA